MSSSAEVDIPNRLADPFAGRRSPTSRIVSPPGPGRRGTVPNRLTARRPPRRGPVRFVPPTPPSTTSTLTARPQPPNPARPNPQPAPSPHRPRPAGPIPPAQTRSGPDPANLRPPTSTRGGDDSGRRYGHTVVRSVTIRDALVEQRPAGIRDDSGGGGDGGATAARDVARAADGHAPGASLGLSHPSRTFITWTWSSRSPRRSRRRSGLVADRHETLRPTVDPGLTSARDGATSSAEWACPVCGTSCNRTYHSGRARVYCTNACRQRAYRWRRPSVRSGLRPHNRRTGPRQDPRRPARPPLRRRPGGRPARLHGPPGHRVRAFARSTRDRPSFAWHTDFIAGGPSSCRTCAAVLHVEPTPVATMLERALRYAAERRAAH